MEEGSSLSSCRLQQYKFYENSSVCPQHCGCTELSSGLLIACQSSLSWSQVIQTHWRSEKQILFISFYFFCPLLLHPNNLVASPPASQSEAAPLRTVLLTLRRDHVRTTAWGPSNVCPSATCPVWRVDSKRRKGGVSIKGNSYESTVMLRASWKGKKMSRNSGDTK